MSSVVMERNNFCSHCGARMIGSENQCPDCGRAPESGGLWGRLAGWLFRGRSPVRFQVNLSRCEPGFDNMGSVRAEVINALDGQMSPDQWDRLPQEVRDQIEEQLREHGEAGPINHIMTGIHRKLFIVRDADGTQRRYASLDEMPPELRRRIEDVLPRDVA